MAFLQEARHYSAGKDLHRRTPSAGLGNRCRFLPPHPANRNPFGRRRGNLPIAETCWQPQPARHFPGSRNQLIRTSHQRLHTHCSRQTLGRLQHISDHEEITLQPGIIGQRVNELLAPFGRKFARTPRQKSAMVGGIVMNNASGMNCGTHANSDKVLLSARIVLADGTVLDTGDSVSRAAFEVTHRDFIRRICTLRDEVRADGKLAERIRYKYSIKNVTGLNLLPLSALTIRSISLPILWWVRREHSHSSRK